MADLIDRQAAIDAVCMKSCGCKNKNCKNIFDIEKDEYRYCEGCDDVEILKALPPVQPERIKGHWIEITLRNHTYKCSVCGRLLVNITDGKNNVAKNYPYCHCGADMRGERNECRNNS